MLHYGQRGLRIYLGTLSCEIDRGLAQVTLVKTAHPSGTASPHVHTPSKKCDTSPGENCSCF